MAFRLGVDTGGTFCDFVLVDESTGSIRRAKVPSTPSDPSQAIRSGLEELGIDGEVGQVTVGTTIATNAVIERRGPKVIYVGNEGFTDVPFIGRLDKELLYDLHWDKPPPLVRRRDCVGAPGRVGHHGEELEPMTAEGLTRLTEAVAARANGEEDAVVAVCMLFSYLRSEHEREIGDAIAAALPGVSISLSHLVSPVWREYERASTTIADAFVKPIVADYAERVGGELKRTLGVEDWNLLASNGGYLRADGAASRAAQLLLSGLAGGVSGARYFATQAGFDSVFTLDMGGTSCDIGLIRDGTEQYAPEFDVAFGLPATIPCVSVKTIGAGGGSIAWLDRGGMLHVGPRSAGAQPGPVAYGRGGEEPTITDANLVLGRLSPEYFLGGSMELDADGALRAYEELGAEIGLDAHAAARSALKIADEGMANAIRLVAVEQGLDPRDFGLIAFGGAGPLHARSVASRLGIGKVLIPPSPGLCSAFGALIAPPRVDLVKTYYANSFTIDPEDLFRTLGALADDAVKQLRMSVDVDQPTLEYFASLRYLGQNFELELPLVDGPHGTWDGVLAAFSAEHLAQYGFDLAGEPVEIVSIRATARSEADVVPAQTVAAGVSVGAARQVWLEAGPPIECPVHRRDEIQPGAELHGPAIIEEPDSTTIALPGDSIVRDESGVLVLTLGEEA
ncbi:MAG: hydantoinase/oxoprolinase family protein [Solirubrobacterales bacterium]